MESAWFSGDKGMPEAFSNARNPLNNAGVGDDARWCAVCVEFVMVQRQQIRETLL
jgi:hypothetical protein